MFSSFCATDGNIFHFPLSTKLENIEKNYWLHPSPFNYSMLQLALLDSRTLSTGITAHLLATINPTTSFNCPLATNHQSLPPPIVNHRLPFSPSSIQPKPIANHQSSTIVATNHLPVPSIATNNPPSPSLSSPPSTTATTITFLLLTIIFDRNFQCNQTLENYFFK